MSPEDAPAAPTPAQRSASTARRERRDRCSYLAGERAGRLAGLKEAAELADAFETENFAMCTDGIMNDPVLKAHRGDGLHLDELREADWAASEECQTHSTIHSSMAHAAGNIAAAIRARIAEIEAEAKTP